MNETQNCSLPVVSGKSELGGRLLRLFPITIFCDSRLKIGVVCNKRKVTH